MERFTWSIGRRDWLGALLSSPDHMLPLCIDMMRAGYFPDAVAAVLLGGAAIIRRGRCDDRLGEVLLRLRESGHRIRDGECDAWDSTLENLPDPLTLYRGTDATEAGPDYGFHWTNSRRLAVGFALKQPAPVLLTATVRREDVCGLLIEAGQLASESTHELLVLPADLRDVRLNAVTAGNATDAPDVDNWPTRSGHAARLRLRIREADVTARLA
jgi:hypothetical protein